MYSALLRSTLIPLLVVLTTSCGFTLRGDIRLPDNHTGVTLSPELTHLPLQRALKASLEQFQINYAETLPASDSDQIHIQLMPESLNRRLLSLFPTGQVAEYELLLTVRYDVTFPGQETHRVDFEISREYQDDPDAILAKSRELDLILHEMRQEAAERIVRLLASQAIQTKASG
ncbi:LPS assembly lipoprotein LptE [Aestuariibacter halophilus]|uniref:LPS-assembly lipoprotein LptE n=1 Tax=Fluctibacter halophilus TaxID=226011 RepID=A0ABS8G5D4_9ALTE|nr:LPS assembly lipoprotein LptE [Aestuariibacter halophilus]MCC2615809.1 LPS assembly lipoprotein LptE [Aestuariibacter halophilus]